MFTIDATHLHQLMNCEGYRLLPDYERPADTDTELRDEGNAVHWLAQEKFEGRIAIDDVSSGRRAYNGVVISPSMYLHVREYLYNLTIGQMEMVTSWGDGASYQINGRADHIGYDQSTDTLDIDDLKYGFSIVEPEFNWTLISHAIGWCIAQNYWPSRFRLRIHQPRPFHPLGTLREWMIPSTELIALHRQIVAVMQNPSDTLQTGNHCFKCTKRGICPAMRASTMCAIDVRQDAFSDELTDEQLADEYLLTEYASKMIKYRLDALKDMATHRVQSGRALPGLQLQRTYSNTQWKKAMTPEMVKAITGRDLTEPKLASPTAAKAAGVPELFMNHMTSRVETGVKLVTIDPSKVADKAFNK